MCYNKYTTAKCESNNQKKNLWSMKNTMKTTIIPDATNADLGLSKVKGCLKTFIMSMSENEPKTHKPVETIWFPIIHLC